MYPPSGLVFNVDAALRFHWSTSGCFEAALQVNQIMAAREASCFAASVPTYER